MSLEQFRLIFIVISLTLVSGVADAFGFLHAAKVWQGGRLVWPEVGQSLLGFGVGISLYLLVIRYMQQLGIIFPEVQSVAWFVMTIVGVAIISGQFIKWDLMEQAVAVGVLAGVGWLILRTGG